MSDQPTIAVQVGEPAWPVERFFEPAGRREARRSWVGLWALAGAGAALLLLELVFPALPLVLGVARDVGVVFGLLALVSAHLALVGGILSLVRARWALLVGFLAIAIVGVLLGRELDARWVVAPQLAVAALAGLLLAINIVRVWWVLALATVMAVSDLISTYHGSGITARLVSGTGEGFDVVAVAVPAFGQAHGSLIGMTDLVFCSLFVVTSALYALPVRPTILALLVAVAGTALASTLLERGLPALPAMAIAFCVVHRGVLLHSVRSDLGRARLRR